MAEREDDSEVRSELEARVYSRSGSVEPRVARFDPASGRVLELTESEWRLLEIESARVTGAQTHPLGPDGKPDVEASEPSPAEVKPRRRRRLTPLAAGGIGVAVGAGLVVVAAGAGNRAMGFATAGPV